MLDRSKLEEGKVRLEFTDFDLHDLLADSLESFATIATGKGIGMMRVFVQNRILANALKHIQS